MILAMLIALVAVEVIFYFANAYIRLLQLRRERQIRWLTERLIAEAERLR